MKYAADLGWSFAVLTQDPDRPVIPEKKMCEFLLTEIPPNTPIIRVGNPFFCQTPTARLGRALTGNSSLPWGLSVAWQGWKKFRGAKPDMIFVNSPPFTNVAIGMLLSFLFSVPLVVDMKDAWVDSVAYWQKGTFRRAIEQAIERKVFKKASAIISVTPSSYADCLKRYTPQGLAHKLFLLPNGEDLQEYHMLRKRKRKFESTRFRLLTAAAGYRPDYRDLAPFLQSLQLFIERYPLARDQIEIEFVGEEPDNIYKTWLEKLVPAPAIKYTGVLDRRALVEHLWQVDLFFLVQPRENTSAISGTLYEYWATGKAPILLFSETGASSGLIVENQIGEHFHFSQVEEASRYIERLFQAFSNHHPIWIESAGVEAYDRRKIAQQMLTVWSGVIDQTRSD